jgi:hypothetical protein
VQRFGEGPAWLGRAQDGVLRLGPPLVLLLLLGEIALWAVHHDAASTAEIASTDS